jgi:hypothetical protein
MVTENEPEKVKKTEVQTSGNNVSNQDEEPLNQELNDRDAAIVRQQLDLAGKDIEIAALNRSVDEVKGQSIELAKALSQAVAAYRELIVQANPGVLEDMITGNSIKEINDSLTSVRAILEKARREIEAEAARSRVPAGAPQRMPPDMSVLSAREKILYGLGGR